MGYGHKTVTTFLTVICALMLTIVGLIAAWPWWTWLVLAVLLMAGAALTTKLLAQGRKLPPPFLPKEDLPIEPLVCQEQTVRDVTLPSDADDYDFIFSAVVRWDVPEASDDHPHINPAALAVEAVLERARELTLTQSPHHSPLVQHRLSGALGVMLPDDSGRVLAMADHVSLMLSEQDQERLNTLASVRKDEDIWKHARKYEQSKRTYLGEDVLKDAGSAVVWWLARNDERIEDAVDRIGVLAQLAAAANNGTVQEEFLHFVAQPTGAAWEAQHPTGNPHHVPPMPEDSPLNGASPVEHVRRLLHSVGLEDTEEHSALGRRIAQILEGKGTDEAVEAIRRGFTTPASPGNKSTASADDDSPEPGI
ncbi:hypothetical protein ACFYWU_09200 [Streptomyces chrestomyceticus]|uniref:hypothetical protein n=1 Tax=Streptomyces chrestomyceticus TaxID=68185 RepID=UPI0036BCC079